MHRKQRGVTALGWVFLLVPVAIVLYAGIRLVPVYLNYTKVARVLEQLDDQLDAGSIVSAAQVRVALDNRLYVEGVDFPTAKEIDVRKDGSVWLVQASYEDEAPLFANISLRVVFDKLVEIR